jgi:hypothetical protein
MSTCAAKLPFLSLSALQPILIADERKTVNRLLQLDAPTALT